jgi:DNA-binding response OmpR family regulator
MHPAESATPPTPGQPDPQRPRVALCEPDSLLRALLEEWLRRAGFEPVGCAAAGCLKNVALVIADVAAPRRDGADRVTWLRRRFPHARVLAISAQFIPGMRGAGTTALELGADAVLAKPFDAGAFMGAVHSLAARHVSSVMKSPRC